MAYNDHDSHDYYDRSSHHQSIPLQDLSRPPDGEQDVTDQDVTDTEVRRMRSGSEPVQRRSALTSRRVSGPLSRKYERIAEASPSPTGRATSGVIRSIPQSDDIYGSPYEQDRPPSPFNATNFAQASVGLSFTPASSNSPPTGTAPTRSFLRDNNGGLGLSTDLDESPPLFPDTSYRQSINTMDYFSPLETDRTPLTDVRYLQPMSGAAPTTPEGQRHDRSSFSSVRFEDGTSPGSRLGDDLQRAEAGYRGSQSSRSRSTSPSGGISPLSRAGSMMRMVSQRVVNLSNEPEVVEHSIRRKSSIGQARLEEPPSFPAIPEYAHDGPPKGPPTQAEKLSFAPSSAKTRKPLATPLKGKSLGIFPGDNKLRNWLCELLIHPATEPIILVLIVFQTVLLAVDSARPEYLNQSVRRWGDSWIDYMLFGLFCFYSLELLVRIIVSGFISNPHEHSTLDRSKSLKSAIFDKGRSLFVPHRQLSIKRGALSGEIQPSIMRSLTGLQDMDEAFGHPQFQVRERLARRAFLRHSFNRLDFLAVVSYWIAFAMSISKVSENRHIYLFQMLSCLRILRLLSMTAGTSVILRSLKKAAPLLLHVAFLIGFFWLLFAIVGVQSFKSSLRRTCVWVGRDGFSNYTHNSAPNDVQFCGGYLDSTTGQEMPWLNPDGTQGEGTHKGYLCPQGSRCVLGDNPYEGTVSFDNVLQSLELVFVIMTSNTFSDLLYYTADSDYLAAALYFAAGIVIMSLWLMNLLIAVITSSFQVIREESRTSAFRVDKVDELPDDDDTLHKSSVLKVAHSKTYWVWVTVILYDFVVQCLRSSNMHQDRETFIDRSESAVTVILLLEIVLRFAADWRDFHKHTRNWVDLGLAIITAIIQIPPIRNSGQPYAWLSFFQIVRIYRVVLAFSITHDLIMTVLGNVTGILNLILFVALVTFLTAIFASQLFRGEIPESDSSGNTIEFTFSNIWNSYIGMYTVLSSENWTTILYNVTQYGRQWNTGWIGAAFFIMWFILANFITLNMFIAVIQESFDVSEDEKRMQQVKAFLQQKELGGSGHGNLSLSTIFKLGRGPARSDPIDYGPATMEMLLKDAVVRDFLDEPEEAEERERAQEIAEAQATQVQPGALSTMWGKLKGVFVDQEPNPFYARLQFSRAYEDLDPRTMAKEVVSATEQRKKAQRKYLQTHPTYNVSLFLFGPRNPIRRLCQRIVGPGRGSHRIEGVEPYKPVWYAFSALIYAAIVAMVLIACITTPLYQKAYFNDLDASGRNWFVWTDLAFAVVFAVEALIKVIADGFFWTPNAYFRSSWGFIDGVVLVTLWINVVTSLYKDGSVSRAVGAFKALRALRLLNVSDSARDLFHSVIIIGGWKVLSAAFVSLSFLFPFALYGLNLFNGQMQQCNDGNFPYENLSDCVGEYKSNIGQWDVLSPRQVANPYYDFDNFGDSLFILFQIVSQEGWVDVMWSAMSMTGKNLNPQAFASQGNAVFFIVFNLLGAVFVLTLFVSVFMRNYTEQTGVAFLTADQRSWLELRKLLRQIKPSKRSVTQDTSSWKNWCYRTAVKKHGRWQRFVTLALMLHVVLLVLEFYGEPYWWQILRNWLFIVLTVFYIVNIAVRCIGLGWQRFCRSTWDLYSIPSVFGTLATTLLNLSEPNNRVFSQLHKLFLVSIALLLIPRNNQLDQLFKTAAASLTVIANLLATWLVLFLVYAIALTQTFGLTKFGDNETGNLNFRDVPKALIFLFRISSGEGWNQLMEDFATMTPPVCTADTDFFKSDCGSPSWARALFISWNIVSMYIFMSLFVSLIFESFSYVYQRSSGLSAVTRNEIRRFKHAWATVDPEATGYVSKADFPRLLGVSFSCFPLS